MVSVEFICDVNSEKATGWCTTPKVLFVLLLAVCEYAGIDDDDTVNENNTTVAMDNIVRMLPLFNWQTSVNATNWPDVDELEGEVAVAVIIEPKSRL